MVEPQHPLHESSGQTTPPSSPQIEYTRPSGRSIRMTETVKFEIDSDDPYEEVQVRKQLGLDSRYPIGCSGRPVAGSKRAAKALDKVYGAPMKENEAEPKSNSASQGNVSWGVKPPESFTFGTLDGNGDANMKDT